jgi:hypothetical protein
VFFVEQSIKRDKMNASNHDPLFTLHYPQDGKHYEEDKENLPPNMKMLSQVPPKQPTKTAYSPTAALSNNNNTIADENKSPKVNNEAVMAAKTISPRSPAVYSSVSASSSGPRQELEAIHICILLVHHLIRTAAIGISSSHQRYSANPIVGYQRTVTLSQG